MNKKEEALEKLQWTIKPDPGTWKEDVQWCRENRTWVRKSKKIAFIILRILRNQNRTQKDLVAMMKVSPQQVNKWVKWKENFTLETLNKVEDALEIKLLSLDFQEEIIEE